MEGLVYFIVLLASLLQPFSVHGPERTSVRIETCRAPYAIRNATLAATDARLLQTLVASVIQKREVPVTVSPAPKDLQITKTTK